MKHPRILRNPRVRWAIEPGHQGTLRYIDGPDPSKSRVPDPGAVLTLSFIVDAASGMPCTVRVTRVEHQEHQDHTLVIPVVVRAEQD